MQNYKKEKVEIEELTRDSINIPNLPQDFIWHEMKGGRKMQDVIKTVLNTITQNPNGTTVLSGYGPIIEKTISCAELIKRKCERDLHQVTHIRYRGIKEYWKPIKNTNRLEDKVIERKIPMVCIVLSTEVSTDVVRLSGYQAPDKDSEVSQNIKSLSKKIKRNREKNKKKRLK